MAFLFKLKWLNGPLAGRELALPAGDIRLGGPDPDLAVPLEQGREAVISVTTSGLTVSPASPVWVAGQRWGGERPLPLGAVIDLAGLAFILGTPETELSAQPIPPRRSPRRLHPQWLLWSVVGACIALAALMAFWPRPAHLGQVEWLRTLANDPDLIGMQLTSDPLGVVTLRGNCSAAKHVEKLRHRLRLQGLSLRDESTCADRLLDNVRRLLMLHGYLDVDVRPGERQNTVVIHGGITANDGWQRAAAQLQTLKGLHGWRVENDLGRHFSRLLELLTRQSMLDGLSITVSGKTLLVSGQLDPANERKLLDVLATFNQNESSRLKARFQNLPSDGADAGMLPATIVSLGGRTGSLYVELANGMRLRQGAVLPSGFMVHSLSASALVLRKEQQLMSLPLNL